MGKGWEGIASSRESSEHTSLGSCEAHHISCRQEEDRGGAAGEVGEIEEGGVEQHFSYFAPPH
jgi:hypothetical protein